MEETLNDLSNIIPDENADFRRTHSINIKITSNLRDEIKDFAQKYHLTMTGLIERAVILYMKTNGGRALIQKQSNETTSAPNAESGEVKTQLNSIENKIDLIYRTMNVYMIGNSSK